MSKHRMLFASALMMTTSVFFACAAGDQSAIRLAHIRLTGSLDETPVADEPLFGGGSENFKSKLDRIKKAAKDPSIHGLVLYLDGISVGWGKVDELRRAVSDFRAAGKKVYAYMAAGESHDYLVATVCDEICVPESGSVMLTGLRMEISFYKDLFEKVNVKADMLQIGDFKGAAEPYTRSEMSPELRKQMDALLDDLYEKSFVEAIARGRAAKKWSTAHVKKLIDDGPYTAKAALAAGLIDRVAYADQFVQVLKTELNAESVSIAKNYGQAKGEELDLSSPFALFKLFAPTKTASSSKQKIAVIYATGTIVPGRGGSGLLGGAAVGSTTMVEAIRQAEDDTTVKAIVLRVDSPGGSALASDLIWNELRRTKKPLIASMSDVAASGGYYISMAAEKIFAEPGTITGSIGVVGGKFVVGGLESVVGVKTQTLSRGANSGILSSDSAFSVSERKVMVALMQDVYDQFLEKALLGRKKAGREMTRVQLEGLAAGRVWTGRQAKENGLVDELGTLDDALAAARKLAGVKEEESELLILPKPVNFFEAMMENKADARAPGLNLTQLPLLSRLPEWAGRLRGLEGLLLLRSEPVWAVLPMDVKVK